jgi:hypothetical protein
MFSHTTRLSLAALLGCAALNVGFACRAQEAGSQDPLEPQHALAKYLPLTPKLARELQLKLDQVGVAAAGSE